MPLLDSRPALVLALLLAGSTPTSAATCTWLGAAGAWASPSSWSCGAAPTEADDVVISAGIVTMDTGARHTVQSLTLTGGTLGGPDSLRIVQTLVWEAGTMTGAGATHIAGSALFRGAASKVFDREVILAGQTEWSDGTLLFRDGGVLRNRALFFDTAIGTHAMARAGGVTRAPLVHNQGRWQIMSAGTTSTVDVLNEGTLIVSGGGLSVTAPARFTHAPAAVLTGSATLDLTRAAGVAMGGRVEPGGLATVGRFEVRGLYPMGPQHVLDIDVTLTVPSSDLLQIQDGDVTVDGRLVLRVTRPDVLDAGLSVLVHGGSGTLSGCYDSGQVDVIGTDGMPIDLAVEVTCSADAVSVMARPATAGDERPTAPGVTLRSATPTRRGAAVALDLTLPRAVHARIDVLDALGRRLVTLADQPLGPGTHRLALPTAALSAGLYTVRLDADGQVATRRLTIVE